MSFIALLPIAAILASSGTWTCSGAAADGDTAAPLSSPITLEYKRVNGVPIQLDLYPVGDHLVTNVSRQCLQMIVAYCPKSYDRDPTCNKCILDHEKHIRAAGCPQDLLLIDNFYCSTMPNATGTVPLTAPMPNGEIPAEELRPLLIYIHGGGWSHGTRTQIPDYVRQLAEVQRYVLASVEYRLTSQGDIFGGDEAVVWPAQLDDCLHAVQTLYESGGRYGADVKRMACLGTSAGGHLCSMVATYGSRYEATKLKLAVPLYGPTNLVNMTLDIDPDVGCRIDHDAVDSFESRLLGSAITNVSVGQIRQNLGNATAPWPGLVALARSANPVNFVDGDTPPMFLAHGTKDGIVPYNQSQRLLVALRDNVISNTFVPAVGCDHASEPRDCWQLAVGAAQGWLTENL